MPVLNKYVLIAAGIITALLLFSATILPMIIRSKAVAALQETTGREVRIEAVSINPLTLTVTITGFAIAEKTGPPLAGFSQVQASLSLASIFKRALILSQVTIDTPSFNFTRTGANRYSFSDIVERLHRVPKKEKKGEFLFSINNITIKKGSLDFEDRGVAGGVKHTIRSLETTIPFISNIPYLAAKYTEPTLSAVVNGAPFGFSGKLKPLSKSLETLVHIDLKQLSLPTYTAYSPVPVPVDVASGTLTIATDISYRISEDKKPELTIKGLIGLNDIQVNMKGGRPLAKIPSLEFKAARLDVFAQKFEFDAITLDSLELFVSRDKTGDWMYSQLLPTTKNVKKSAATAEPAPAAPRTADKQRSILVSSFVCTNALVHFSDAVPAQGFKTTISEIDFSIAHFSTAPETSADYELSLLLDNTASFSAAGTVRAAPLNATAELDLTGLSLQRGWPYLAPYLTAPVAGSLDVSALVAFNKAQGLRVDQGTLSLKGLSTRYGTKEGLDLALLQVNNASFHQQENRLDIDDIRLSRGNISLSREADGSISLLSLLTASKKSPAEAAGTTAKRPTQTVRTKAGTDSTNKATPFSYRVKHFQVDALNTAFTDKSREEEPHFTLRNTQLSLSNITGPKAAPAALRFSSTFGTNSQLKANGDITPLPFRYKGSVTIGQLPLRAFEAYVPDNINVYVIGGSLDTAMNMDVSLKDGASKGTFSGSAGVRSFHSIDAVAEEDLLKWESLQFDGIQGNLAPFSLGISQVALNNVYSRIVVRKDGSLNLQNLVEKPDAAAQTAPPPAKTSLQQAPATVPPVSAPAQRKISVGSVTIQDGTLSFTDNHLPQTFSSTFFNLGGRVSGLSSEESKFAEVDLRGNLDNHSPLQITGTLNPLRNDLFVDLKVSFRDIDLSPVTPYSGTYLGYSVDKGKLFLELSYLINKKQLDSTNKIFIDQFTFGKKVDSAKATNLPVHLAVALLKDSKGEIHLDLPVTGRTDDPKFSIWGVIGQVFKNLLVKVATSPFALLSSLTGGGQDFSSIRFAVGSSTLIAEEQQKLVQLAKALADRPGLKVEINGFVDKERDPEGYRQELFGHMLRHEKFLSLVKEQQNKPGESAETVTILADEYSKYINAVYKKEKFPKPRNALGLVKELPDAEIKKLIIANIVVADNELLALARERTTAVMSYLATKGGLAPERLFQKNENIYKAPEKSGAERTRVEFNAIVQ